MPHSHNSDIRDYVSLGIFAHYTVRNRVASLWRSVPRDAWDSDGAWIICLGLSVATVIAVPASFFFEVPYRYFQAVQSSQYQAYPTSIHAEEEPDNQTPSVRL